MIKITIDNTNENQRLDKYLQKYLNKAPKSFIYKMLRKKNIKLNDKKANGNEILAFGDNINIYLSDETIKNFKEEKEIIKTKQNFKIIFEDKNIIICYKPIGLVSQPDANNKTSSLNDELIYYLYKTDKYKKDADFTPSICNRLDRNTSGIVVFGKNLKSLQALNLAFKTKTIDKYYLTAVEGKIDKNGIIKLYHKKEKDKVQIYDSFIEGSKEIITEYTPLKTKENKTLLKIKLITGKTHQIRASFEHIGFSIIGDRKYNKNNDNIFGLKGQFLHCYKLEFVSIQEPLSYLNGQKFLCSYMDKSFKNVLKFFDYKMGE